MTRRKRFMEWVEGHPHMTVLIVAAVARLTTVVAVGPLRAGVVVPDETQYLGLAAAVASGRGAESWQPGYGGALYFSTATFMRPLSALVWIFGPHQLVGQLLAAVFGVATAVLTTLLAIRLVRRRLAVLAGLIVALLPSQVLWSSLVLRESMVWTTLVLLALTISWAAAARSWRQQLGWGLASALSLYGLADLRGQTAVVAAFALLGAALVVRTPHRVRLIVGALAIASLAPALASAGPFGYTVIETALPRLAVIRANLSLGAHSSTVRVRPLPPAPATSRATASATSGGSSATPSAAPSAPAAVVTDAEGNRYAVDDTSPASSVATIPRGLVDVTLRPFPWEPASDSSVRLAQVENVAWGGLYLLALAGVGTTWRRREELAFPALVGVGLLLVAAVTQGNLGTAFRHRSQMLWLLAIFAVLGAQWLQGQRTSRQPEAAMVSDAQAVTTGT